MNFESYLKNHQPIPYKIFFNSLSKDCFNHAYLLSGPKGSSLNNIAKFLAKSLICTNSTFACETCSSCQRVEKETYGDLLIFDAKLQGLKANDIREKIELLFSKTSQEKRGIKVYIINNIEYLDNKASNMLLKFIEEPPKNTYAIFTTESEAKILPTIISRLEIVHFQKIDQDSVINAVVKEKGSNSIIHVLSYLFNSKEDMLSNIDNKNIKHVLSLVLSYLERSNNYEELRLFVEKTLLKELQKQDNLYLFYDILVSFLKEALKKKVNSPFLYKPFVSYLDMIINNFKNIENAITTILLSEQDIALNLNLNSLILYSLTKIF